MGESWVAFRGGVAGIRIWLSEATALVNAGILGVERLTCGLKNSVVSTEVFPAGVLGGDARPGVAVSKAAAPRFLRNGLLGVTVKYGGTWRFICGSQTSSQCVPPGNATQTKDADVFPGGLA